MGVIKVDLSFLEPMENECETCKGARFKASVLTKTYKGKSIANGEITPPCDPRPTTCSCLTRELWQS